MSVDEIVLRFDSLPPSMASGSDEGPTDQDAVWIRAQALSPARTLRVRFEGPVGLEFTFFAPQPPPPRTAALTTSWAAEALHGGAGTDLATSDPCRLPGPGRFERHGGGTRVTQGSRPRCVYMPSGRPSTKSRSYSLGMTGCSSLSASFRCRTYRCLR